MLVFIKRGLNLFQPVVALLTGSPVLELLRPALNHQRAASFLLAKISTTNLPLWGAGWRNWVRFIPHVKNKDAAQRQQVLMQRNRS